MHSPRCRVFGQTPSGRRANPLPWSWAEAVLDPMGPVGQRVHEALHQRALTVSDGVAGAALMAVKHLGGTVDEAMLAHIRRQLPPP